MICVNIHVGILFKLFLRFLTIAGGEYEIDDRFVTGNAFYDLFTRCSFSATRSTADDQIFIFSFNCLENRKMIFVRDELTLCWSEGISLSGEKRIRLIDYRRHVSVERLSCNHLALTD